MIKGNFLQNLVVTLVSATAVLSAAPDYLPLAVGNTWVYQSALGETFQVQVRTPFFINGNIYYALAGYGQTQLLVRYDAEGNLVHYDSELEREILLTSFEPFESGWWEAPHRDCLQEGQTQVRRGTHTGPGGNWNNTLELRYRVFSCGDAGTESEQYAENVGMLRRVVSTIAGPRTYNLIYARIGTQTIEAGDHGQFTVSARPWPTTSGWLGTVRLDLGRTPGLRLGFPTSQIFEAILRDDQGKEVWRWSADQFFTQAITSRNFTGEWSMSFVIPHPGGDSTGTGVYTLEGYLTNTGGPHFGGAVRVAAPLPATPDNAN